MKIVIGAVRQNYFYIEQRELGTGGLTMPEYIEREASIAELRKVPAYFYSGDISYGIQIAIDLITKQPTTDVAEVRHGTWKLHKDGSGTCDQCGGTARNVWDYDSWQNYCGRCGARMDGDPIILGNKR